MFGEMILNCRQEFEFLRDVYAREQRIAAGHFGILRQTAESINRLPGCFFVSGTNSLPDFGHGIGHKRLQQDRADTDGFQQIVLGYDD